MRVVVDTNVLISGVFFGGLPRMVLSSIVRGKVTACATAEIIDEYEDVVQEMADRKHGHVNRMILSPLIRAMEVIETTSHIEICRDPDDNKFLECAKDSRALYIVSGDKDLLVIKEYENIQIITAKEFCERYLDDF